MKLFKKETVIIIIGAAILVFPVISDACTAYVKRSLDGRVVLCKNRDSSLGTHHTEQAEMACYWTEDLRMFKPDGKNKYVALMYSQFSTKGKRIIISSGINEHGLSVTYNYDTAQATEIKNTVRSIAKAESNVTKQILENAKTVSEAKKQIEKLKKDGTLVPMFIAMSDKENYAIAEIAAINIGEYTFQRAEPAWNIEDLELKIRYKKPVKIADFHSGIYVANHFDNEKLRPPCEEELTKYNYKLYMMDSVKRLFQIERLMQRIAGINVAINPTKEPYYSMEAAMMCAKDHHDGEIDSINRESTKALFITEASKDGPSKLFIEFTSPAQMYNRAEIVLDDAFWSRYGDDGAVVAYDKRYIPAKDSEEFNAINDLVLR